MQTKLTLRIDEKLISRAKRFAKTSGKSLSQIVADYFSLLDKNKEASDFEIPPTVKSLLGSLNEAEVNEEDYYKYLEEKYK